MFLYDNLCPVTVLYQNPVQISSHAWVLHVKGRYLCGNQLLLWPRDRWIRAVISEKTGASHLWCCFTSSPWSFSCQGSTATFISHLCLGFVSVKFEIFWNCKSTSSVKLFLQKPFFKLSLTGCVGEFTFQFCCNLLTPCHNVFEKLFLGNPVLTKTQDLTRVSKHYLMRG